MSEEACSLIAMLKFWFLACFLREVDDRFMGMSGRVLPYLTFL